MSKAIKPTPRKPAEAGFTIGRAAFAKISAVEGVKLTRDMQGQFQEFDRQGLSPDERRRAIIARYGKGSA